MYAHRFVPGMSRHLLFRVLCFWGFLLLGVRPGHAALLETCRVSDSELTCKLRSILAMLDTAAWILGLLLFVAVVAAVFAYRRKPRKLRPEEIVPDDI